MVRLILLIIGGIMFFNTNAQDKPEMSVKEMKKAASDPSFIILDVRTPEELKGPLGKIDGVINIPLQQLGQRMDELKKYKDKEIAVICRSGNRSEHATEMLRNKGYNAKNVLGGMIEYQRSNK